MLQYVPYYLQGDTPSPTDALVRHDYSWSLFTANRDTLERLIATVFWSYFKISARIISNTTKNVCDVKI